MAAAAEYVLTVFAWGNISRGDDAIGPMLAEVLRNIAPPRLHVVEDHQLNVEHVIDLDAGALALFIDASVAIREGCVLQRIGPVNDGNFSTHSISPQALLNVYQETVGKPAPDAWLLHVAARDFKLGGTMGTTAAKAVDEAAQMLRSLCALPANQWRDALAQNEHMPAAVALAPIAR